MNTFINSTHLAPIANPNPVAPKSAPAPKFPQLPARLATPRVANGNTQKDAEGIAHRDAVGRLYNECVASLTKTALRYVNDAVDARTSFTRRSPW